MNNFLEDKMKSGTGLLKGLFLLVIQVIIPMIITLIITVVIKEPKHFIWLPLLIGSVLTIAFAYLSTYYFVKKEYCHFDQITLITPALATIIFLIWAVIYHIPWWGWIFGLLFFLLGSIAVGKIIYSSVRARIRVDILEETGKLYQDDELSIHEKEYLNDFIDFSTTKKSVNKKTFIQKLFKKK